MSSELMKRVTEVALIDEKTIKNFLFGSGTKLTDKEQAMFMGMAVRNQLDPFKKEIYCVKYGNDFSVITGYQTYIQRADQSGKLDGWKAEEIRDEGKLTGARVTIFRKDFSQPFVWEIARQEFDKKRSSWNTMPGFMLKKVCIAQAFRLAFPCETAALPYTADEIGGGEDIQEPKMIDPIEPEASTESGPTVFKFADIKPILDSEKEILRLIQCVGGMKRAEIEALWNKHNGDLFKIQADLQDKADAKEAGNV